MQAFQETLHKELLLLSTAPCEFVLYLSNDRPIVDFVVRVFMK